jgi:hypothetical protein
MKNGCAACGKRHGGRVPANWMPIDIRHKDTKELQDCLAVCGWDCMTTWISKETKTMIDPTKPELDALLVAGQAGGEYLESLGRYDLSALSEDEWVTFLSCVVSKYQDEKIPF